MTRYKFTAGLLSLIRFPLVDLIIHISVQDIDLNAITIFSHGIIHGKCIILIPDFYPKL